MVSEATGGVLAVLTSRVRLEEDLILRALERRRIRYEHVDERQVSVALDGPRARYRGVLNRIMSHTRSVYAARHSAIGLPLSGTSIQVMGESLNNPCHLPRSPATATSCPRAIIATDRS